MIKKIKKIILARIWPDSDTDWTYGRHVLMSLNKIKKN
jgi:hypothetical protein